MAATTMPARAIAAYLDAFALLCPGAAVPDIRYERGWCCYYIPSCALPQSRYRVAELVRRTAFLRPADAAPLSAEASP